MCSFCGAAWQAGRRLFTGAPGGLPGYPRPQRDSILPHNAAQRVHPGDPHMADPAPKQLPANAYTPLPPGTVYQPPVAASENLAELTPRSIGWGVFLCVVFTVASAYSGLKVGQVMEAAIPISILAIGL